MVNIYINYELGYPGSFSDDATLKNSLFGADKLNKNDDIDKYRYSGYGIGFDRKEDFPFLSGGCRQKVIIFRADMSSSVHAGNKKKDILILEKGSTQELDEHSLASEKLYLVNVIVTRKKFCLRLKQHKANSYLLVNGTENIKFKAKDSEIVATLLCLGNISKDWSVDNMKSTGFNGYVYDFSVDYNPIAVDDILDIHKYLMKKNNMI